ncbi:hypothetical protein FRB95_010568, partial [Tulasnella sp. JGI-2019a]
ICIVADYCFGVSMRAEQDPDASEDRLVAVLHTGIEAYKRQQQENVLNRIHERYSDRHLG